MPFRFNPFTGNLDEVDTTAAAGSDTQVQVNDGGKLAGFIELLWNKVTKVFTVKGDINLDDGGTYATTVQMVTPTANRTISFPDATGTVGLVAGSSGQLIWNSSGAQAGLTGSTVDGSGNVTLTSVSTGLGTAGAPTHSFTGDPNTGIYSPGADQVAISTNGQGRLFVDASGNVGVGSTAPLTTLECRGQFSISNVATSFWVLDRDDSDGRLKLLDSSTSTNERLAVDTSGRLLIGTSTSNTGALSQYSFLQVKGTSQGAGSAGQMSLFRDENSSAITADEVLGRIMFGDRQAGEYGQIHVAADGTAGSGDYPGRLVFSTTADAASSPTERMRIDSSGRVGIGTTSPAGPLEIKFAGNDNGLFITAEDGTSWGYSPNIYFRSELTIGAGPGISGRISSIYESSNNFGMSFYTTTAGSNSEKARIDSSGKLLVGTSSARANFYNSTATTYLQVEGTNYEEAGLAIICNNASAGEVSTLNFAKSNGSSVGSNTLVASGDNLGYMSFQGNDGSEFVEAANIKAQVDGTPGASDMPGRLVFSTTADGASSPTERMRITSDGYVRLASGTGGIQFNGDTAAANALDDYEEGTWTPIISDGTNDATAGATNQGRYTKIGNRVYIDAFVETSSLGSVTGDIRITGFPFTSVNSEAPGGGASCFADRLNIAAGQILTCTVARNTAYAVPALWDAATGTTLMQASEWSSDGYALFAFTYQSA
jgi:hypothetical protein